MTVQATHATRATSPCRPTTRHPCKQSPVRAPPQVHHLGPPMPPCEEERMATINALKRLDAGPDEEIASILKLVQSIFKVPRLMKRKRGPG
jgi:hypothetical protein